MGIFRFDFGFRICDFEFMKGGTSKTYPLLLLIFILTSLSAIWFDWYYRLLVIKLYILSTNGKIHFIGKNFLFFTNEYYLLSFGAFCTIISFRLLKSGAQKRLFKIILTVFSFFLATAIICYINSNVYVARCTACTDSVVKLIYGHVNYDAIFIESLGISLLTFFVLDIVIQNNRLEK